mmetsp:Transcript_71464/g.207170  ORF Transcript_71464/g.207170 Transcript_71464/m.207170 type:complete len:125 (+) Transcript_71464:97-471(+)
MGHTGELAEIRRVDTSGEALTSRVCIEVSTGTVIEAIPSSVRLSVITLYTPRSCTATGTAMLAWVASARGGEAWPTTTINIAITDTARTSETTRTAQGTWHTLYEMHIFSLDVHMQTAGAEQGI